MPRPRDGHRDVFDDAREPEAGRVDGDEVSVRCERRDHGTSGSPLSARSKTTLSTPRGQAISCYQR
ncbi:hypothetical protein [Amycolatopsis sp. cmx-11-51]|uniref:hypothetical protein n=1 Tax=unclassified Amycolatopsis TaxID=2618356 RepID=UPI0039E32396